MDAEDDDAVDNDDEDDNADEKEDAKAVLVPAPWLWLFGLAPAEACSLRCELDDSMGGGDSGAARKRAIDVRFRSGDVSGVAGFALGFGDAAAGNAAETATAAADETATADDDDETEIEVDDDDEDNAGDDGAEADGDDDEDIDEDCGGRGARGGGERKTSAGALMAAAVHVKGACASEPQR